jgi:hypothetical protein
MQTVYYSLMRNLSAFLLLVAATSLPAQDGGKAAAPPHGSIVDAHEGVSIWVEPWTQASRYKEKFPKKSPLNGGVVALHVSFRNDNEQGVKVDLQRIRLLVQIGEDNRQELAPLSAEDVADTVLLKANGKDPTSRRIPLPIPVGQSKPSRDSKWTELRDACQNAGMPSGVVAAHSTIEGLVYFDLRGEMDLLQTARLYVPNLSNMGDNQPLSYFDIDLSHGSSN